MITVILVELEVMTLVGRQMVFIELCAGSAVLSAAAQRHGYRVLPVDCKRNRHKPRCRIVSLDLAEDHAWEVLEYIVDTCDVAAVHLARLVAPAVEL